jgi:hypothetical protein
VKLEIRYTGASNKYHYVWTGGERALCGYLAVETVPLRPGKTYHLCRRCDRMMSTLHYRESR